MQIKTDRARSRGGKRGCEKNPGPVENPYCQLLFYHSLLSLLVLQQKVLNDVNIFCPFFQLFFCWKIPALSQKEQGWDAEEEEKAKNPTLSNESLTLNTNLLLNTNYNILRISKKVQPPATNHRFFPKKANNGILLTVLPNLGFAILTKPLR